MNLKHILGLSMLAVAGISVGVLTSCGPSEKSQHTTGSILMACDASFQNIMEQQVEVFEFKHNPAVVVDSYMDESAAIDSLLSPDNNYRICVAARPLNQKELKYIKDTRRTPRQQAVAVDAVALIVNPENPIEFLDHDDIAAILTGKITQWDQVGNPDARGMGDIAVVFDGPRSSTVHYMRDSVLNGAEFGSTVYAQSSPKEVFEKVAKMKNAIGVIGVSWLTSDLNGRAMTGQELNQAVESDSISQMPTFSNEIKVLGVQPKNGINFFYPTQQNIYSGDYPYHRQIYLISTGTPHSVAHSFYVFVTSWVGQKLMLMSGVCPKVITPQFVEL